MTLDDLKDAYIRALNDSWKAAAAVESNLADGARYGQLCEEARASRERMSAAYSAYQQAAGRSMKTVEILRMAKESVESGWVQGAAAVNAKGCSVLSRSPDAVRWCALGAVWSSDCTPGEYESIKGCLADLAGKNVSQWNDTPGRTQAEVLDLFDRAIEAQEE